jgi:transcription factor C subunit 7
MPEDPTEDDFKCFTCSLSVFKRRAPPDEITHDAPSWNPTKPDDIPAVDWKGKGLLGGWNCEKNGDCSFLTGGEERGW